MFSKCQCNILKFYIVANIYRYFLLLLFETFHYINKYVLMFDIEYLCLNVNIFLFKISIGLNKNIIKTTGYKI